MERENSIEVETEGNLLDVIAEEERMDRTSGGLWQERRQNRSRSRITGMR